MNTEYQLLTEKETARLLAVSPGTLRVQRCVGATAKGLPMVPYLRIGRAIRYRLQDIQQFIDGHDMFGIPEAAESTDGGGAAR